MKTMTTLFDEMFRKLGVPPKERLELQKTMQVYEEIVQPKPKTTPRSGANG